MMEFALFLSVLLFFAVRYDAFARAGQSLFLHLDLRIDTPDYEWITLICETVRVQT